MEFAWSIQQQTADSLHVRSHSDYQEDSSAIGHSAARRLLSVAGKFKAEHYSTEKNDFENYLFQLLFIIFVAIHFLLSSRF